MDIFQFKLYINKISFQFIFFSSIISNFFLYFCQSRTSIENSEQGCNEEDMTDDFGGASNIEISYNVDDYDIIDDDEDAQDVLKTAATSN